MGFWWAQWNSWFDADWYDGIVKDLNEVYICNASDITDMSYVPHLIGWYNDP